MRKILVAVGSGQKNGNTDQLTDAFIKGAEEKGHEIYKFFLGDTDLHGCRGCGACQKNGNVCVVKDYMQEIYPKKDTVFLMTSEDDSEHTFDIPDQYYRFITEGLGFQNVGTYYAGGCHEVNGKKQIPERHRMAAYELGKSI